MKKITLSVCFLLITAGAQSQPANIYPDFTAFINNAPQRMDVDIEKRSRGDISMVGGNDYKIDAADKTESKKLKKVYWAVERGDTLFLNGKKVITANWYMPVLYRSGNFLYFRGCSGGGKLSQSDAVAGAVAFGAIGGAAVAHNRYNYLLLLQTGETIKLTKKKMKEMLINNSTLAAQYNEEKNAERPEVIIKYLKELSKE